jgi:hypothetical protein
MQKSIKYVYWRNKETLITIQLQIVASSKNSEQ